MTAKLFEPITIGGVELRNRIAMSPMCMHSAEEDGCVTDFHIVHYGARALGGAGLVFLETTAVMDNGLIGPGDIGIWSDDQVKGLAKLTRLCLKSQETEMWPRNSLGSVQSPAIYGKEFCDGKAL